MKHFSKTFFVAMSLLAIVALLMAASSDSIIRLFQKQYTQTTASVAQSTTTNYALTPITDLRGQPDVAIHLETVQVSGTSGGTAYLEVSNDVATSSTDWVRLPSQSWTYTGAADDTLFTLRDFQYLRLRVSFVNNGTTQATTQKVHYVLSDDDR